MTVKQQSAIKENTNNFSNIEWEFLTSTQTTEAAPDVIPRKIKQFPE